MNIHVSVSVAGSVCCELLGADGFVSPKRRITGTQVLKTNQNVICSLYMFPVSFSFNQLSTFCIKPIPNALSLTALVPTPINLIPVHSYSYTHTLKPFLFLVAIEVFANVTL